MKDKASHRSRLFIDSPTSKLVLPNFKIHVFDKNWMKQFKKIIHLMSVLDFNCSKLETELKQFKST